MEELKWNFIPSENPCLMNGSGIYFADTTRGEFAIGHYLLKDKADHEGFCKVFMALGLSLNTISGEIEFKTLEEAQGFRFKNYD